MPGKIEGKIASVAASGNFVTDLTHEQLAGTPRDPSVTICCDEHETVGLFLPDHHEPDFSFLALLGESGFLELTIVGDSAKVMLGIRVGEPVSVRW